MDYRVHWVPDSAIAGVFFVQQIATQRQNFPNVPFCREPFRSILTNGARTACLAGSPRDPFRSQHPIPPRPNKNRADG